MSLLSDIPAQSYTDEQIQEVFKLYGHEELNEAILDEIYGDDDLAVLDFWPDGDVGEAFYQSDAKLSVIRGPFGSAKTKTCAAKLLDMIMDMEVDKFGVRRSRALVFRNYEADLLKTTIPDFLSMMPDPEIGTLRSTSPITYVMDFVGEDDIPVHCEIRFMPLENVDEAIKKLKGTEFTFIWGNEISEQKWMTVQTALGRMGGRYPPVAEMPDIDADGRGNRYRSMAIFDTNSFDDEHWLYQLFEAPTPEQEKMWALFNQPGGVFSDGAGGWVTNPKAENINNLGKTYYSDQLALASKDGKSQMWIRINLANLYGSYIDGVPCWPNYNQDLHDTTTEDYIEGDQVYMGMDFGRTPAVCFGQKRNGGYIIFDEYTSTDMSAEVFAPLCARWLVSKWGIDPADVIGWCDPSGNQKGQATEQQAIQEMRAKGFTGLKLAPVPGNNTLQRRKSVVQPFSRLTMTGNPALKIHQRCKTIRGGARGKFYMKKVGKEEGADERYADDPLKNFYSHVCEALEYLMCGWGEGTAYDGDRPKRKTKRKTLMPAR